MATEVLTFPDPASGNVNDGAQEYDLAVGFTTAVDGYALGVEWFPPVSAPGTIPPTVSWWRVSDGTLVAEKEFTANSGVRQQILFDTPVAVPAGAYRVSVHTIFFTLTSGYSGWPVTSDNMATDNPGGYLSVGPGYPSTGPVTSLYHMAPIWEPAEAEEAAELTGVLALPALDMSGAATASSALTGALTLPALDMSGAGASGALATGALTLPALDVTGALAIPGALTGALALPALDMTGALVTEVAETSSPNAPIRSTSRPHVLSTISRAHVITSGGQS